MELVKYRLQHPNIDTSDSDNLFDVLHAQSRRAMLIDHVNVIREHASKVADCVPVTSDDKCVHHTLQALKRVDDNAPKLIIAQLHDFRNFLHATSVDSPIVPDKEKLKEAMFNLDANILQIQQALPTNTLMVVATLQGDANYFYKLQKKSNENPLSVTSEEMEKALYAARRGISFFAMKE